MGLFYNAPKPTKGHPVLWENRLCKTFEFCVFISFREVNKILKSANIISRYSLPAFCINDILRLAHHYPPKKNCYPCSSVYMHAMVEKSKSYCRRLVWAFHKLQLINCCWRSTMQKRKARKYIYVQSHEIEASKIPGFTGCLSPTSSRQCNVDVIWWRWIQYCCIVPRYQDFWSTLFKIGQKTFTDTNPT